jgi:hypothetical protein
MIESTCMGAYNLRYYILRPIGCSRFHWQSSSCTGTAREGQVLLSQLASNLEIQLMYAQKWQRPARAESMLQSVGSGRCVHARTLGCQTRGPSVTASITTDSSQVSRHDDLCPVVHPCANSRTAGRGRARLCLWLVTAKCLRFRLFVGPLGARRPASSRGSPDRDRPPPLLLPLPVDCNDAKRNMVAWRPRNTCLSGGWSDASAWSRFVSPLFVAACICMA